MLANYKKILKVGIIIIILILVYNIFKYITMPSGKKEYLKLENTLTIEINVDKWYSDRTVKISKKDTIEELQNFLNSLELIELEKDYGRNNSGHLYTIFMPYDDISIKGEYLCVHPSGTDDKVFTEYYIVNSGYNPITGGSKVSRFIDKLIDNNLEV